MCEIFLFLWSSVPEGTEVCGILLREKESDEIQLSPLNDSVCSVGELTVQGIS